MHSQIGFRVIVEGDLGCCAPSSAMKLPHRPRSSNPMRSGTLKQVTSKSNWNMLRYIGAFKYATTAAELTLRFCSPDAMVKRFPAEAVDAV